MSTVDSFPIEIRLEPGVGALASQSHQVAQVVPVCVELVEGAELGHHVRGLDAVYQHSLQRVVAHFAVIDQLGDEGDRPHLAISEELKLISLMRFMIPLAVVGSLARSSGLI